ncbi:DUF3575 domain-containing protein [Sphingobacterium litopenaei]|uniref:DUF3575 domain-containing protein n=1 Tax=Sphingobacterium litopenaei TaxID=2763500 RepID=A0ABR7YAA7_9SPHI|nr:DUF3575 domain-containing protein [Sphingobacterium litopenaei]MBD1428225.1 DUF3575 domain-containing protein [Sphingobacterium litopenaei]
MKNILLAFAFLLSWTGVKAQEISNTEDALEKPNFVKLNLLTLVGGKISVEYERVLNKRFAVGAAVNLRPENSLPFKSSIMDIVDDSEINSLLDGMKSSSTAIIPEVKYYLSKKGYGQGFYLAPYVKYAKLNYSAPYTYDVSVDYQGQLVYDREETISLKGDLTTFTAGISAGINFKLKNNIFLDWRIIGPGYGTSKGSLSGKMTLNADEQAGLREQLGELKESLNDLPLKFKMDYTVHGNGADITLNKSPWASIRSGLSIAYKF